MKLIDRSKWQKDKPQDKGRENCPLCAEKENVVWTGEFLKIIHCKYAILGLENHLMVIPNRHVLLTQDLCDEEFREMKQVEKYMSQVYKGDDYFSFIRQAINSRSLEHLHYHYLPGSLKYKSLEEMLQKQGY